MIGVDDEEFGQRLKAFVVLGDGKAPRRGRAQGAREVEPRRLQGAARGRVPRLAAPQRDRQSTSATRGRSWSRCCCAASWEAPGLEPRLVINVTDINDKIYDAARAGRRAVRPSSRRDDPRLHRGHRSPGSRPPRRRAAGDGDDPRDHGADRGADRARPGLRGRGRRLLPSAQLPGYGKLSNRDPRRWIRARRPVDESQARTRSTSRSGRRASRTRTAWDSPVGRGPSGLAHRVLGDGRGAARPSRSTIHGGGSDLVFPHHENEIAQTEAARGECRSRATGCTTAWSSIDEEKMSKSEGNIFQLSEALERSAPRRWSPTSSRATTASRSSSSSRRRERGGKARVERIRNFVRRAAAAEARAPDKEEDAFVGERREALRSRRSPTTSTPRGPGRSCSS